jgi:hypothetical protein
VALRVLSSASPTRTANFTLVDEYLSQNEDADTRAKAMHDLLKAWKRAGHDHDPGRLRGPDRHQGAERRARAIDSPYRVYAIDGKLKAKTTGICRVENDAQPGRASRCGAAWARRCSGGWA